MDDSDIRDKMRVTISNSLVTIGLQASEKLVSVPNCDGIPMTAGNSSGRYKREDGKEV